VLFSALFAIFALAETILFGGCLLASYNLKSPRFSLGGAGAFKTAQANCCVHPDLIGCTY